MTNPHLTPHTSHPTPPIRVLIADDHAIFRQGLATIINCDPEMQVIAQAENGEQAIALFGEHQPDVTLMDLRMPEWRELPPSGQFVRRLNRLELLY
ncbi:response regulator transcription factor [Leptolyngbya sp. PL-A3]|nr:response regulator transcription factor [Leptolyngbya sp. FACHB-16]